MWFLTRGDTNRKKGKITLTPYGTMNMKGVEEATELWSKWGEREKSRLILVWCKNVCLKKSRKREKTIVGKEKIES